MADEAPIPPPDALPSRSEGALAIDRTELPVSIPESPSPGNVWAKIKRHKVVEWTLAYIAFAYALLHGVEMVGEAFDWSPLISKLTIVILLIGIPIAAVLAYYHGHRARHRISGAELGMLIALLVIAGSALWFISRPSRAPATLALNANVPPPMSQSTPAFSPPPHSIAVLPFTNLSGDPKQEYFSDGISEELINALTQINALEVAARTSSFSFKGRNVDIGTIARKLDVAAILEGSIRRSGNTVRITAQLINTVSGFHIWSHDYDRELKNMLVLQTDIATTVAQQLQIKLLGDEAGKIEAGGTQNPEAYDAFLQGTQLLPAAESEADYRAVAAMDSHAIALDPNYAAAYAQRAVALMNIMIVTNDSSIRDRVRHQARQDAEKAVAIAPNFAEAHGALWFVRTLGFSDFSGAASEIEYALALAPGSARVQEYFAVQSSWSGYSDMALEALRRAVRLDPQNYRIRLNLAIGLYNARRFDAAMVAAQDAKALKPDGSSVASQIWMIDLALGRPGVARQFCQSSTTPLDAADRHDCLARAYHALGKVNEAESELKQFQHLAGTSAAYEYAEINAQWGNASAALEWLAAAERLHDPGLQSLKVDWELDPVRNTPQFKALAQRLNFSP